MEALDKFFKSVTKFLKLIDSRTRLWGAILILVFSLLTLLLFNDKIPFNEWYIYLFFMLAIIISIGGIIDLIAPRKSESYNKLINTSKKISGRWGEFLHNHEFIALSVNTINFNTELLQFILESKAYNKNGIQVAKWKSSASSVSNFSPIQLHYFWNGQRFFPEFSNTSGIGIINFNYTPDLKICTDANGSYTSENIHQQKISGKEYSIAVKRILADELKANYSEKDLKTYISNHSKNS